MTISEIAREFNVSPVTVSNALNRRKGVAPELADRIRDYARRNGYQPSYLAKSLLKGHTSLVGLCLRAAPSDPWFAGLVNALQNRLFAQGLYLNTIIAHQLDLSEEETIAREKWVLDFFAQIKAECILIGPLDSGRYQVLGNSGRNPKLVAFDALDPLPIDSAGLDIYGGIHLALQHLMERGHRKIGYIGANQFEEKNAHARTRLALYYNFLRTHNLEQNPEWVIHMESETPENIVPALTRLLESGAPLPSAFFCHNDNFALIAAKTLAEHRLVAGKDISLVGFDNQPVSSWASPGFTTVGFDLANHVEHITELVLAKVRGESFDGPIYHLEPARLIERNSVAALKQPVNF